MVAVLKSRGLCHLIQTSILLARYEEYVNEFLEKYESYKDLDKTLQTYRYCSDFRILSLL